jgi:hypothetical protein
VVHCGRQYSRYATPQRRLTPIIMLSADPIEPEAWRAGVDQFLLKPNAISEVPSTVTRLLKQRKER